MKIHIIAGTILLFSLIFTGTTSAHPGKTAADGCHYCRTNCDSWGVAWNERHCHNGAIEEVVSYTGRCRKMKAFLNPPFARSS